MWACLNKMTRGHFQGSLRIGLLLTTIFALGQGDLSQFYDQVDTPESYLDVITSPSTYPTPASE